MHSSLYVTPISLSSLFQSVSVCLSVCIYLSFSLSFILSRSLHPPSLSLSRSVCLSASLYLFPPPLSIYLFLSPFLCLVCLSVCLFLSFSLSLSHSHTHKHTHTHTHTHTLKQTHTHIHTPPPPPPPHHITPHHTNTGDFGSNRITGFSGCSRSYGGSSTGFASYYIQSIDYSSAYPPDLDCYDSVQFRNHFRVSIYFYSFHLDDDVNGVCQDYLEVGTVDQMVLYQNYVPLQVKDMCFLTLCSGSLDRRKHIVYCYLGEC